MKTTNFPNGAITMAGHVHLPENFSADRTYAAIVCTHPAGGVKKQTAGIYAGKLAAEGFVKHLHIVPGASHIGMYDKPDLVAEAMAKLAPFFKAHL